MSHFSTIKTKVKEKDALLEALLILGYDATVEPKEMVVTGRHAKNHPTVHTDIQIKEDIGFFLNPKVKPEYKKQEKNINISPKLKLNNNKVFNSP